MFIRDSIAIKNPIDSNPMFVTIGAQLVVNPLNL
jgi:hypothetical protein